MAAELAKMHEVFSITFSQAFQVPLDLICKAIWDKSKCAKITVKKQSDWKKIEFSRQITFLQSSNAIGTISPPL